MSRIRLAIVRNTGWRSPNLPEPLPISEAAPLWKALQGRLIHRPRNGMVYLNENGTYRNTHFKWLCGNSTNKPIRVTAECMEGLEPCKLCQAAYCLALIAAMRAAQPVQEDSK